MAYASIHSARSHDEISQTFEMEEPRLTYTRHPYARQTSMSGPNTPYTSYNETFEGPSDVEPLWAPPNQDHDVHSNEAESADSFRKLFKFLSTVGIQAFAFAWLVPIGTLLYLNLKREIIGASAWCPFGDCYPSVWADAETYATISSYQIKFDKATHNLLGFLQLIAKVLEVWFILITTWLVYLVTMWLARHTEGMPIGYLTRASEFAELPGLFDGLLWRSVRRPPSSQYRTRRRMWFFLIATIFLCVICNLMGPAVAVLLLPSLQWIHTPHEDIERFMGMNANVTMSPYGASYYQSFNASCTQQQVIAQQYTCNDVGAATMDAWIEGFASSQKYYDVLSIQGAINFAYNGTYETADNTGITELVVWTPTRQMIEKLNDDLVIIKNISNGVAAPDAESEQLYNTFNVFNSTVQSFVQRSGPIMGAIVGTWADFDYQHEWSIVVDDSRSVKCYGNYNISNAPFCWEAGDCAKNPDSQNYTRCISIGEGWDDGSSTASFTIYGNYYDYQQAFAPNLSVNVYTSGHVAWFNQGQLPQGLSPDCIVGGTAPSDCDWGIFFSATDDTTQFRSGPVTTIDISRDTGRSGNLPPSHGSLVIDFTALQWFGTYSYDVSWLTNWLSTASFVLQAPLFLNTLAVDPSWVAAAWGADVNGFMPSARSLTYRIEKTMDAIHHSDFPEQPLWRESNLVNSVSMLPILQTLSLIDFDNTTDPSSLTRTPEDNDPQLDNVTPLLSRWGRINVYAYGLSSRTSVFGVIVTIIGGVVVLTEVYMGSFVDRRRIPSPTQLVVAALEHPYSNEFHGHGGSEKHIWRTRFRVKKDKAKVGGLAFEKIS